MNTAPSTIAFDITISDADASPMPNFWGHALIDPDGDGTYLSIDFDHDTPEKHCPVTVALSTGGPAYAGGTPVPADFPHHDAYISQGFLKAVEVIGDHAADLAREEVLGGAPDEIDLDQQLTELRDLVERIRR